ncbi:hypothetical protein HDU93_005425 [Gonapodya sp. JEL0774]|nr:hypothetical protein HDU93_005425 [Gonapodya sp. JEL0774]
MADTLAEPPSNRRRLPSRERERERDRERHGSIRGMLNTLMPRKKRSSHSLADAKDESQSIATAPSNSSRSVSRASAAPTPAPTPTPPTVSVAPPSNRLSGVPAGLSRASSPTGTTPLNSISVTPQNTPPSHKTHSRSRSTSGSSVLEQRQFIQQIAASFQPSNNIYGNGTTPQQTPSPATSPSAPPRPPEKRRSGYGSLDGSTNAFWSLSAAPLLPNLQFSPTISDDLNPSNTPYSPTSTSRTSYFGNNAIAASTTTQAAPGPYLSDAQRFSYDSWSTAAGLPKPPLLQSFGLQFPPGPTSPGPLLPASPLSSNPPQLQQPTQGPPQARSPTPPSDPSSGASALGRSVSEPWRANGLLPKRAPSTTPSSAPAAENVPEGSTSPPAALPSRRERRSVRQLLSGLSIHKRSPSQPPPTSQPRPETPTGTAPGDGGGASLTARPSGRRVQRATSDADALLAATGKERKSARSPSVPAASRRVSDYVGSATSRLSGLGGATDASQGQQRVAMAHMPFSYEREGTGGGSSPKLQPLSLSMSLHSAADNAAANAAMPRSPKVRPITPGADPSSSHARSGSGISFSALLASRMSADLSRVGGDEYTPVSRGPSSKLAAMARRHFESVGSTVNATASGGASGRTSEDGVRPGRNGQTDEPMGAYAALSSGVKLRREASRGSAMTWSTFEEKIGGGTPGVGDVEVHLGSYGATQASAFPTPPGSAAIGSSNLGSVSVGGFGSGGSSTLASLSSTTLGSANGNNMNSSRLSTTVGSRNDSTSWTLAGMIRNAGESTNQSQEMRRSRVPTGATGDETDGGGFLAGGETDAGYKSGPGREKKGLLSSLMGIFKRDKKKGKDDKDLTEDNKYSATNNSVSSPGLSARILPQRDPKKRASQGPPSTAGGGSQSNQASGLMRLHDRQRTSSPPPPLSTAHPHLPHRPIPTGRQSYSSTPGSPGPYSTSMPSSRPLSGHTPSNAIPRPVSPPYFSPPSSGVLGARQFAPATHHQLAGYPGQLLAAGAAGYGAFPPALLAGAVDERYPAGYAFPGQPAGGQSQQVPGHGGHHGPVKATPQYPLGQDIFVPNPDLDSSPELKASEGSDVPSSDNLPPGLARFRSRRSMASRRSGRSVGGEGNKDAEWSDARHSRGFKERRKSAAPSAKSAMSIDYGAAEKELMAAGSAAASGDLSRSRSKASRRSRRSVKGEPKRTSSVVGSGSATGSKRSRSVAASKDRSKHISVAGSEGGDYSGGIAASLPFSSALGSSPDGMSPRPSALRLSGLSVDGQLFSRGAPRSPQSPSHHIPIARSPSPEDGSTRRGTERGSIGWEGNRASLSTLRNGWDSRRNVNGTDNETESSSNSAMSDLLADYEKSGDSDGEPAEEGGAMAAAAEERRRKLLARRKSARSAKSGKSARSAKSRSSSVEGVRRRKSAAIENTVRRQGTLKNEMAGLVAMLERKGPSVIAE